MSECKDSHFICPSDAFTCLPVFLRCNGVFDCPLHEDEAGCDSYTCPGFYRCRGSRVCVHPDHVCDGVPHCPQRDDELLCHLTCPHECVCHGWAFVCKDVIRAPTFPQLRYLDVSGTGMTPQLLLHNRMLIHLSLAACHLEHLENLTLPNLRSLDISGNQLTSVYGDHFSGVPLLYVLFLAGNPLVSVFPAGTVNSDNLRPLSHLPDLRVLDLSGVVIKTLDTNILVFSSLQTLNLSGCGVVSMQKDGLQSLGNLRLLDLRGCPLNYFPKGLFKGLDDLQHVFADSYRVCCAAVLPKAFSPEGCSAPEDVVSSCESLLRSKVHRVSVPVFASLALIGNVGSLVGRALLRKQSRSPASSHAVFVTHLSLSDFVMGLYLAMIGVADRLYQGTYLWEDFAWRHSVACQVAGFLALLSSEVSVFVVVLLTLDRLLVIYFSSTPFLFSRRSAQLVCAVTWLAAIVLASLPLYPYLSDRRWFSQTAICSPLSLVSVDYSRQHFADGLLLVPGVVLSLFVAVGQIFVYAAIKSDPFVFLADSERALELSIARRLVTTAVCKCLCWFLLGVLRVLALGAVSLSSEVHVGVALLLLPLSSVLDPCLCVLGVVQGNRRQLREQRLVKRLQGRKAGKGQARGDL